MNVVDQTKVIYVKKYKVKSATEYKIVPGKFFSLLDNGEKMPKINNACLLHKYAYQSYSMIAAVKNCEK